MSNMQTFSSGATRSVSDGKPEYAGYLHPHVIKAFGAYMLAHQTDANGNRRDCRNHKQGIPAESYMQSMFRHFVSVWEYYEIQKDDLMVPTRRKEFVENLMALMFNVMGMASLVVDEEEPSGQKTAQYSTI